MSQPIKCTPGGKNPVPVLAQRMTDLIDSECRGCRSLLSTRTIALQLVELIADHIRNAPAGQVDPVLVAAWLDRNPGIPPVAVIPPAPMEDGYLKRKFGAALAKYGEPIDAKCGWCVAVHPAEPIYWYATEALARRVAAELNGESRRVHQVFSRDEIAAGNETAVDHG